VNSTDVEASNGCKPKLDRNCTFFSQIWLVDWNVVLESAKMKSSSTHTHTHTHTHTYDDLWWCDLGKPTTWWNL